MRIRPVVRDYMLYKEYIIIFYNDIGNYFFKPSLCSYHFLNIIGTNHSKVVLKPRHEYVPKVLSTQFRAQVISSRSVEDPFSAHGKVDSVVALP